MESGPIKLIKKTVLMTLITVLISNEHTRMSNITTPQHTISQLVQKSPMTSVLALL